MRFASFVGSGLLILAPVAAQAASIEAIGRLAGDVESEAIGLSGDGRAVVGNSFDMDELPRAFVWRNGVSTPLVAPPDTVLIAEDISRDGTTAVGSILTFDGGMNLIASEAFRWRAGTGVVGLGDADGGSVRSAAFACTQDGNIAVGTVRDAAGDKAGRWDGSVLSLVALGDLPGGDVDGAAFDISDDGRVIGGDADVSTGFAGFRWTMADGMVQLADLPGGSVESFVDGVSSDGSALVGWSSGASGVEATLWVGLGAPQGLGDLPNGDFESYAYAVSLGGKRVVGESHTTGGYRAFLWDQVNGMRALGDVLSGLGVDMTGWTLDVAYAISPNGRWVVGTGETPQGNREGFIADLPEPGGATSALAALLALGALAARRRSRGRRAHGQRGIGPATRPQRRPASTS
jgi:uncharacterized membrane protein